MRTSDINEGRIKTGGAKQSPQTPRPAIDPKPQKRNPEEELAKRDRMLRRAAETMAAVLEAERLDISPSERDWCIAQAEGWLADYEAMKESTTKERSCGGLRQEQV